MSVIVQWLLHFLYYPSWNWDEDWSFPVLWPLLGLPDLLIIVNFGQNILKNCLKTLEKTGTGQPWAQGKPAGKPLTGPVSLDSGLLEQGQVRENHKICNLKSWADCKTEHTQDWGAQPKETAEDPVLRRWWAIPVERSFSILVKTQRFPLEEVLNLTELTD